MVPNCSSSNRPSSKTWSSPRPAREEDHVAVRVAVRQDEGAKQRWLQVRGLDR